MVLSMVGDFEKAHRRFLIISREGDRVQSVEQVEGGLCQQGGDFWDRVNPILVDEAQRGFD